MKAERINKNQIRFTLNKADLQERQLKVTELAYGSDKTKALFDDMIHTALTEFGFDFSEKPLMIEAIPISEESLMITVTKVSGQNDLAALFGLPETASAPKPKTMSAPFTPSSEFDPADQTKGSEQHFIYRFTDFSLLCRAAALVPDSMQLKNQLYKDEAKGIYYLAVRFTKTSGKTRFVLTMLGEYATDICDADLMSSYLTEHCRLLIKTRALQKLSAVEHS